MAKSSSPTGRRMAHDGLTVGHIANRIGNVPSQKGLTTAHLAHGLAQGGVGGSSSMGQGTNPQSPATGAAATQSGTTGKS
jgi:hypothetical protein